MTHSILKVFQIAAILGCISSSIYYLACLWSAKSFLRMRSQTGAQARLGSEVSKTPPVSILKPLKGIDPEIYESFRSHCVQDYSEYEIIFGVSDADDPAIASVEKLQREFPKLAIRLVHCSNTLGSNVKVSNLEQMLPTARYEHLIVNDSDIRVEPDYLRRVVAPLTNEHIGMVTCLYRGVPADTMGSRLEALGISTDFCSSVLVARRLEGELRFGLGSTLALRRADLERIGGFKAIVDFLADDYELGRRIAGLGLQVVLSDVVVETHLPAYDVSGFIGHQMRWNRGVRDARTAGYAGLVFTFGLTWALLNVILARGALWSWAVLAVVAALRGAVAIVVGRTILHDESVIRNVFLLPLRDLIAAALWVASFFGHTVMWRGDRFELKNGRLIRIKNSV
jgi:ceramide glucosyltransferase